jgi:hypothetical protein
MINVNQITSQLARMPDPALQKYAQMHKDDPYVMALAMSEFNRRKQMRQGAQANAPEQPKVVDQAIASMTAPMPDDVGIGQLPAGNMNFADGGIVAFGDGGEVERYQSGGSLDGVPRWMRWLYANESPAEKKRREQLERAAEINRRTIPGTSTSSGPLAPEGSLLGQAQRAQGAFPPGSLLGMWQASLAQDPEAQRQMAAEAARKAAAAPSTLNAPSPVEVTGTAPARVAPSTAANAGPGTGGPRRNTGTPPPAAAAAAAPAQDDVIESLRKRVEPPKIDFTPSTAQPLDAQGILALQRQFEVNPDTVVDPLLERRQALAAALQSSAEENLATRQKQLAEMGVLGAERETRLKAREEKLGKQEKDLGPLAMLQAGFAMMSGASPYALKNIGIGAQAGLKTYSEGIDKLATAREKLDDAFGQLEIARRSERMMTDKEISGLRAGVKSAIIDGQKLFLDGADKAYGMAANKAQTAFNAVVQSKQREVDQAAEDRRKLAEMQSAGAREAMQQTGAGQRVAAQLTVQERVAKMEADVKKAEAAATRAALERRDASKTDQELIEIRAKSPLLQQRYPDVNEYLRIMKGTAALQAGQQLSPADQALIQKYLKP